MGLACSHREEEERVQHLEEEQEERLQGLVVRRLGWVRNLALDSCLDLRRLWVGGIARARLT